MADLLTSRTIEELRANLSEKLEELHRRANTATKVLTPARYWNDPIVRFGIGVAIGLAIGSRGKRGESGHDGLLYSMVRAGLTATTTALITRAIAATEPASEAAGEPPGEAATTAFGT